MRALSFMTTRFISWGMWLILVLLGLDIILVLLGGMRIEIGDFRIRSTTIEFPLITFLILIVFLFVVKGKRQEAILFVVALLLSGILGEGVLRLIDHPLSRPYLRSYIEPSSLLGTRLVPDFEGFGPLDVVLKVNSQGFRDFEHQWEKESQSIRIVGLGDSFTFGWGLPIEATFLKVLEGNLQRKIKAQVETINAGVPGWGLINYILYLEQFGKKYVPDVVVVAYYADDLSGPKPSRPSSRPRQLDFEGGYFHHFRVYNFFKSIADKIRYRNRQKRIDHLADASIRREQILAIDSYLLASKTDGRQDEHINLLKKSLSKIKELTDEMGASLIVMFIPDAAQLNHPETQFVNELLFEYTNHYNISFLDMTPIFEQSSRLETFYLVPKDWHTNELGHQKMAEALSPLVCQALRMRGTKCT